MIGYIDAGGKYHRDQKPPRVTGDSSQHKAWLHDRQRADHRADLVQPWVNGKPNEEFKMLYPEESKKYYG